MLNGLLSVSTIKRFIGSKSSNYKELIKCVSLTNQPCKARPVLIDINLINFFYLFTVSVNNCGGSCSAIDD